VTVSKELDRINKIYKMEMGKEIDSKSSEEEMTVSFRVWAARFSIM